MGNTLSGRELLPDPEVLALCAVEKSKEAWVVEAASPDAATCPACGALSSSRHSRYLRQLRDLPIQGVAVNLTLQVGRWRCRNPNCDRQIFCQRLANVTHNHAQETNRY